MSVTAPDRAAATPANNQPGHVDCDVHVTGKTGADLDPFLSGRWRKHRQTFGGRLRNAFLGASNYPRMSAGAGMRADAWPPAGGAPGSDLGMLRSQLLDAYGVTHAMMIPPLGRGGDERNTAFGAALCTACNDWQAQVWCDAEPRLRACVQVNVEDTASAIAEIEKRAGDRRFVQVMIQPRGLEPLGRPRYRPILAACAANGFPVVLHIGGSGGHPSTGGGWPSFYHEEHPAYPLSKEALVVSLVCEGVFEDVPKLRVVLVEGGYSWLPPLSWRLDKHYLRLRAEVPHMKRLPSEIIAQHIWVTTQPIEEPEQPEDLIATMEWVGWDHVMFSTDYPHWDQDDPRFVFPATMPRQARQKVFRDNAIALYGLAA